MQAVLLSFFGSASAGMIFNIRGKRLIYAGISGAAGYLVYLLALRITGQSIMAIFIGAIAVGIYSETCARLLKTPSTLFSIPGIFPIVPGVAAYETIQYLADNNMRDAGVKLVETLGGSGAIAFGIIIVTAAFRLASGNKNGRLQLGKGVPGTYNNHKGNK